jgi:hypothetical protein
MTQANANPGPPVRVAVLCLAGFMGSGKSTVGTLLAKQMAWRFVDLDDRIEQAASLTIPEFFERFGEPAFRQLEAEQLRATLGRAVEDLNESIRLDARNPYAFEYRGQAYEKSGDRTKASADYTQRDRLLAMSATVSRAPRRMSSGAR